MRRVVWFVLLVLLGGAVAPTSSAQDGQPTPLFLKIYPQPRVYALGNATVALDEYSGAIDINPAALGEDGSVRFGTNVGAGAGPIYASDWLPDSRALGDLWVSNGGGSVRRGSWALGAHWKFLSVGSVEVRDETGRSVGVFDLSEWETTVAGAYDVSKGVTLGVGVKLIRWETVVGRRNPELVGTTTPAVDLGVQYDRSFQTGSAEMRPLLGWSLTNFGPNQDLDGSQPGDAPLPMTMRVGAGGEIATTRRWQNRSVFQLGIYGALSNVLWNNDIVCESGGNRGNCYSDADGPFRTLFSTGWTARAFGPGNEGRVSVWEQTVRHIGAEIRFADILSVQRGHFTEDEKNGNREYTTYGFGVDLYYVAIDHAWMVGDGRLNNSFWRLTGRIPLDGNNLRNFWPDVMD